MTCLLDPIGCISGALWQWAASVPWYWWALCGVVLAGVIWKLAGWPGIIALAAGVGFVLGRRSADPGHEHVDGADAKPPFRRKPSTPRVPGKRRFDPDTGTWVEK